jgi:hypothetical protein
MQKDIVYGIVYDRTGDYASDVTVVVSQLEADHSPIPMKPTKCTMEEPGFWASEEEEAAYGVCVANEDREVTRFQVKTDEGGFFYKIFRFEPTRLGPAMDAADKGSLKLRVQAIDSTGSKVDMANDEARLYTVIDWLSSETSVFPTVRKLDGSTERLQPKVGAPRGKFFDEMKKYFMAQAAKPSNERYGFAGCKELYL